MSEINPFEGSFMQPQILEGQTYVAVETSDGTEIVQVDPSEGFVPAQNLQDQCSGKILSPEEVLEVQIGTLARMSASGYLDCTDWCAYNSKDEAMKALVDMYGNE